mmetsp:Transcript_52328/g.167816  ORF Transcript_52328/g.167816 Transcript_52328/m.167816 type:complete len:221 (-) Transcript_52328:823-1485(-)
MVSVSSPKLVQAAEHGCISHSSCRKPMLTKGDEVAEGHSRVAARRPSTRKVRREGTGLCDVLLALPVVLAVVVLVARGRGRERCLLQPLPVLHIGAGGCGMLGSERSPSQGSGRFGLGTSRGPAAAGRRPAARGSRRRLRGWQPVSRAGPRIPPCGGAGLEELDVAAAHVLHVPLLERLQRQVFAQEVRNRHATTAAVGADHEGHVLCAYAVAVEELGNL